MQFYTDGAEKVRIDSIGKVGIGTDAPTAKLDVVDDSSDNYIHLKSGAGEEAQMTFYDLTTAKWSIGKKPDNTFTIHNQTAAAQDIGISAAGDLTVFRGNLIIGTSGKGIDFSATDGTGTSELLDDYEEGTYTSTISDKDGGSAPVPTTESLFYTKIGRQVSVFGTLTITVAPANGIQITLPFSAQNDNASYTACSIPTDDVDIQGEMAYAQFYPNDSVVNFKATRDANLSNFQNQPGTYRIQFSYFTES